MAIMHINKNVLVLVLSIVFSYGSIAQGVRKIVGTTKEVGSNRFGTIFSTDTVGDNFRNLCKFDTIRNPGSYPDRTRLVELNGKFYGMTSYGAGANNFGVIFEWDPNTNIYTKKYSFTEASNAITPKGSLTLYNNKFYGLAQSPMFAPVRGVIFEWDPVTNIFTKKIEMDGSNGSNPGTTMTLLNGKMYGTTSLGGDNDWGVIFEWDPLTNIYTKKFNFSIGNGGNPLGALTLHEGKFFGLSAGNSADNHATIFEWDPSANVFVNRFDFSDTIGVPQGSLSVYNGKFYGTIYNGGDKDAGLIFEWNPLNNEFKKKAQFDSTNGASPVGNLVLNNDKFYGMTPYGGVDNFGVIYEWDPNTDILEKKIDLNPIRGTSPMGDMTFSNGKFFGLTSTRGFYNAGVIFEWNPQGNVYNKKIDLDFIPVYNPSSSIVSFNGKLYGLGRSSAYVGGVIYEWKPADSSYTVVNGFDETATAGLFPSGSLKLGADNKFYGMTREGGLNGLGTIYQWDPMSNVITKKIDFDSSTGFSPLGSLTLYNTKMYGMTTYGGTNNVGVIFEWDPATNIYTKKFDFDILNGCNPHGSLTELNGKFYGMVINGGTSNAGIIFEWDPATNIFRKEFDFDYAQGALPYGSLTAKGSKLYGMTSKGGSFNHGVVFEWDPNINVISRRTDFRKSDGSLPFGDLLQVGDKFFGMTLFGGGDASFLGGGVFFEWLPNGILTKKQDINGLYGGLPAYAGNNLALISASPSNGLLNSSVPLQPVIINSSNNNSWVSIVDQFGDAVAEINAHGNNLGTVNAQLFVHSGNLREDFNKRLYLDRNITISPQFQPASPVEIRLYIKDAEFEAIKAASNSAGQPSGINSINDLTIFKNNDPNVAAIGSNALPISSTPVKWDGTGYVFTASINTFSSFYFANRNNAALPVKLLSFTGNRKNNQSLLTWETTNEMGTDSFMVERAVEGGDFQKIGSVKAKNLSGTNFYRFTDNSQFDGSIRMLYYRLKQTDLDKNYTYSKVLPINLYTTKNVAELFPNPVSAIANIRVQIQESDKVNLKVINSTSQVVLSRTLTIGAGSSILTLETESLPAGSYVLTLQGKYIDQIIRFVKTN